MAELEDKSAVALNTRRKRFVLVVDNSQRDAGYTGMLLQNLGYNSTMVRSGEEALDFFPIAVPSLVIAELVLPGMNGIDLFERLKQDFSITAIPMIIQTKFTDREVEDHCRRAGIAGFLNKPVQAFELYRVVQQAIEPTPRQNIRVPALLTISIDGISSGTEFVTMLSDSGLFVRTLEPRPVGSELTLTFLLSTRIIRIDTVVLYTYRYDENPQNEPGMGMKFINLSPVDKDAIQTYILEHVTPGITLEDTF